MVTISLFKGILKECRNGHQKEKAFRLCVKEILKSVWTKERQLEEIQKLNDEFK